MTRMKYLGIFFASTFFAIAGAAQAAPPPIASSPAITGQTLETKGAATIYGNIVIKDSVMYQGVSVPGDSVGSQASTAIDIGAGLGAGATIGFDKTS